MDNRDDYSEMENQSTANNNKENHNNEKMIHRIKN